MKLRYNGTSHIREVSSQDLAGLGYPDQPDIRIDTRAGTVVDVDDGVGAALIENNPAEWAEVEAGDKESGGQPEGEGTPIIKDIGVATESTEGE